MDYQRKTTFMVRVLPTGAVLNITLDGKHTIPEANNRIVEAIAHHYGSSDFSYTVEQITHHLYDNRPLFDIAQSDLQFYLLHNVCGNVERLNDNVLKITCFSATKKQLEDLQQYIMKHYGYIENASVVYDQVSFLLKRENFHIKTA